MAGLGNNGLFNMKFFCEKLLVRDEVEFTFNAILVPRMPRVVMFLHLVSHYRGDLDNKISYKVKSSVVVGVTCVTRRLRTWIIFYFIAG